VVRNNTCLCAIAMYSHERNEHGDECALCTDVGNTRKTQETRVEPQLQGHENSEAQQVKSRMSACGLSRNNVRKSQANVPMQTPLRVEDPYIALRDAVEHAQRRIREIAGDE
jgi:hypothetical protein